MDKKAHTEDTKKIVRSESVVDILKKKTIVEPHDIFIRLIEKHRFRYFDALNKPTVFRFYTGRSYKPLS